MSTFDKLRNKVLKWAAKHHGEIEIEITRQDLIEELAEFLQEDRAYLRARINNTMVITKLPGLTNIFLKSAGEIK